MQKREARIFYVAERAGRKAIIVFDAGHGGGDVHIYEHMRDCPTKEIQDEVKKYLRVDKLPDGTEQSTLNTWIEKNFGLPISYKLIPE